MYEKVSHPKIYGYLLSWNSLMREGLKNLTENGYWVYGISEGDFDYTVQLVREMIHARSEEYETIQQEIRTESPDVADDIFDDVGYYRGIENQYLWEFALWRLQGLLEAVITYQLIKGEKATGIFGLKQKLINLERCGYSISDEECDELLAWAKLRNAISHAPTEQYRPVFITEEDIVEYCVFVKNLYFRWMKEKNG